jgi:RNA polymerase sigma factor (sigma-70 family)
VLSLGTGVTIFDNNRDLLDRFRRGDRAALAEVYYRYVDDVATLARRGFTIESIGHVYVRGVSGDAEREIVQETFARAFAEKARVAFNGIDPYRPYLMRIAKNLLIDRFRAGSKQEVELDDNAAFELGEEPVDLDWEQRRTATVEYLATLAPEMRQIVRLRFEDELSQDDVAAKVGCSRRRVRTLEAKAQKELRKWLHKRGLLRD